MVGPRGGGRLLVGLTEAKAREQGVDVKVVSHGTGDTLWHAVPSFPTISEVWLRLLEEYGL